MIKRAGIRQLKNQTSRIVDEVREQAAEYVITSQHRPVAVLRPFTEEDEQALHRSEREEALANLEQLAQDVTEAWSSPRSALELLDEQRR